MIWYVMKACVRVCVCVHQHQYPRAFKFSTCVCVCVCVRVCVWVHAYVWLGGCVCVCERECVAHMYESYHTHARFLSYVWMSHGTHVMNGFMHVDESCHTLERILSRTAFPFCFLEALFFLKVPSTRNKKALYTCTLEWIVSYIHTNESRQYAGAQAHRTNVWGLGCWVQFRHRHECVVSLCRSTCTHCRCLVGFRV